MKIVEFNNTNHFLRKELPESIGIQDADSKIKSCFDIKKKDVLWRNRKKK